VWFCWFAGLSPGVHGGGRGASPDGYARCGPADVVVVTGQHPGAGEGLGVASSWFRGRRRGHLPQVRGRTWNRGRGDCCSLTQSSRLCCHYPLCIVRPALASSALLSTTGPSSRLAPCSLQRGCGGRNSEGAAGEHGSWAYRAPGSPLAEVSKEGTAPGPCVVHGRTQAHYYHHNLLLTLLSTHITWLRGAPQRNSRPCSRRPHQVHPYLYNTILSAYTPVQPRQPSGRVPRFQQPSQKAGRKPPLRCPCLLLCAGGSCAGCHCFLFSDVAACSCVQEVPVRGDFGVGAGAGPVVQRAEDRRDRMRCAAAGGSCRRWRRWPTRS